MSEPTPGLPREETYRKGDQKAIAYVNERGIVECSAEFIAEMMRAAGWVRE